jgi:hypothetical protein
MHNTPSAISAMPAMASQIFVLFCIILLF